MKKRWEKIVFLFLLPAVLLAFTAVPPVLSAAEKQAGAPVDLNNASQQELTDLKGIGPATAKKIIAGRPYKSVDELSRAGLSAKKIDSIRPYVTVGAAPQQPAPAAQAPGLSPQKPAPQAPPAATGAQKSTPAKTKLAPGEKVNINTADAATLEKLPGIGPAKAQAIIAGRPYAKPEDIMKVKGIKQGIFNKVKDSITVR